MKKTPSPWTPEKITALVATILRSLPANILALAVLTTACLAPDAMLSGLSAVAAAIKAFWR